jgi:signal transduction histidine kinase
MRFLYRLRTQLILSHLIAIATTLVAMVGALVLIVGGWFTGQQASLSEPTQEARVVASAIGGLVNREGASSDLNAVLRAIARGDLHLLTIPSAYAPVGAQRFTESQSALRDIAYIVVVGSSGQVLASSEPQGAAFAPPERAEWDPLVRAALAGARDPRELVSVRSTAQPATLGAYPVLDESGRILAVVVVGGRVAPPAPTGFDFWHSLVVAGAASAAVLAGASVFALVSAGLVGYLLSRRLVGRLERLGRAAEGLAGGDLSRRVEEGAPDEAGQLARRFNAMAARLAQTVGDLTAARDRTEAALRAKRELVANVSHELRTPLALIRGYVETLLMPASAADPARRQEYLAVIERETENLSRLIDDLFALSTAEAGALLLKLEPVALSEVIQEVGDSLAPLARRERQIAVVTRVPADLPPALGDRQRVVQVLANLARNALRYTPEGGLIALCAEQQDGRIVVSVEDTGEGIPADQLPHIFERFYRGDASRERATGGAGLGLAIVRELVEAMGGDVSVASTVGRGSRFCFRLPLAPLR